MCEPHRGPGTDVVLDLTGEDVGHLAVHAAITGNTVLQASLLVIQMLYSLSGLEKHKNIYSPQTNTQLEFKFGLI